ncbi:MAG TPA: diaminopimelate epimerase [Dysgonomonas sp.]|uniref:Diaminopimelate epimerase n=1 Tax=uncultured Dysgonomonas sp. TaxID=206096 RepID=A0A212JFW9_9BACT|nr:MULTISPECIES: diaminopimelate epimerase [Dysgonomonas]MBS5795782.1 diaminopimelate epimerase [Dysgonomonas mossii]MBS5905746.1 diaminopimelate epimerase [Dysgonomonas mossii]MBS7111242.1 diaminopimelate epimerase [Dysgonomonas mossii]SBV98145.1 Diaminopimelate epimerase [uncultured Dysgonomonas sp.]HML64057.1 diaminopimelate epimerase [Dysgonomonas sp.]
MKKLKFTKMHGAGNDYIYMNGFVQEIENPSALAIRLSNRNFGIGSDGLVLILPSENSDFRMQMFNSDGSEAEMCGNASRCVGKYVYDNGLTTKKEIALETKAGVKYITLLEGDEKARKVTVDMGEPILDPVQIPVKVDKEPVLNFPLDIDGKIWEISCVSMGNPHAVVFTTGIKELDLPVIGPKFEKHPIFPRKTNTEFIEVVDRKTLNMRVWERGAGETLACGTGACAAAVAAILNGYCDRKITIHLIGGDLEIEWDEQNNHVYMTGEAVTVFEGEIF